MEKKVIKKLLIIIMIITILAADFFVLGSNLITYAVQLSTQTSNSNIEFSAYFKEGENRVDSIETSIKAEDVKLYAEIKVKNEGYIKEGAVIEIKNSNFNLKDEILSSNTHIASIEGNKVNLKQITNGESVEIELGIEPAIAEKITADFLSKTSTVKLSSTYIYSQAEDGTSVQAEKSICVDYKPDETTGAELVTDIITNKVLSVNGTSQRVVQLLIKSRLTNNEYPVKQTTLNVNIPELSGTAPQVSVLAINETTQISNTTTENGTLQITLNNEVDANNQISWNKNVYDEMVVTYLYPETVDASKVEITTNSELILHNSGNTYTATYTKGIENQELNSVIIARTETTTEEIYKGQIYANIEAQYNTKTAIVITNANVADEIIVHEGPDAFGTVESELTANTKYIATEINLEKMLAVLGQDGSIEIKNGGTTTTINKDTTVDANGNVVIAHGENATSELEITTSKSANAGILEIKHIKAITGSYDREDIKTVTTLKTKNTVSASLAGTKILENTTEQGTLELKETISKAELTIENNKKILSTTETNEVALGITLITDGTQYDLYKNPKISLEFPAAVENVELISTPGKQNADSFTVNVGEYNPTNKTIQIDLQGEQTRYPESVLTQAYIQLNLNVTLSSLAISQTDKIMMTYINENASQYEGGRTDVGIVEQAIEISAPSQLIKMFNLTSNANTSLTEPILQQIKNDEAGKTLDFEVSLINNEDTDISNVKILGKLPTTENTITGEDENTLETILKNVTAPNATIYYTENADATEDIEDTANGWTTDLSTLTNAKLYLITIDTLARGAKYTAIVTVQIPKSMTESGLSYTQYEVIYDDGTENGVKDSSRSIGLASSLTASIKTEITAKVGQETINSGDTVKEGEVIRYTVTLNNRGTTTLENVQLKLDVPEGTTYVQPIEKYTFEDGTVITNGGYVYAPYTYYEEITDSEKLAELTTITIPQLTTEPYTVEYEVRVNKGAANTKISNKPTIIHGENEMVSTEFNNIIQESNVRVTIKRAMGVKNKLYAGSITEYVVYVENMSSSTINNLEMQIISDVFKIQKLENDEMLLYGKDIPEKITISEISTNDIMYFSIQGTINNGVEEITTSAIVKDVKGNIYKSNFVKETVEDIKLEIGLTSPQNKNYIKEGDLVEYNITAQNTGDNEANTIINFDIPNILQVQSIELNGNVIKQCYDASNAESYIKTISNTIYEYVNLTVEETALLKITAKVLYIPDIYHGKTIKSSATIRSLITLEDSSEVVTHILKASLMQDDNLENVISGFAWFDANANGQKDGDEENLPEIIVKLYDLSAQRYLTDENGNAIQTKTDTNGEYAFTKISNGSYLVIFEYDTEKYVFTTALAEGTDDSINSKVVLKSININERKARVAAIELSDLKENVFNMNIGLKENIGDVPSEEQPSKPGDFENPVNPENPTDPENPVDPEDPENPVNPENPGQNKDEKTISGFAWLDANRNGQKDTNETTMEGIKVKLYDISIKNYVTETTTDANGKYTFKNIQKGSYILIFEYDTEEYEPTTYLAEGVATTQNSKVVLKKININGQEMSAAVTDTINIQDNVDNINIGLKETLIFDLELNKYISRIVVQTSKETKAYDYKNDTFEKVEIHRKQIQGSLVVLEYTIKVKNNGEIAGYAKNIVDYLPSGLTFSSELNKDWYLSGNYLYTKSLENVELNPGEEKELKLILTKTMTNENVGLINNRAEIEQDYNKYGESDIDSTPNNQAQDEDDFGTTDVIIQVATGGSNTVYIILLIINAVLIGIAITLMIKNNIIKLPTKKERR